MEESCDCMSPFTDYPSLSMKDGKPHCLISQPYELDMESLEDITHFCKQHGLSFTIEAYPAFHFPTRALFVAFQPAEKAVERTPKSQYPVTPIQKGVAHVMSLNTTPAD
jgi:hypothetical protein